MSAFGPLPSLSPEEWLLGELDRRAPKWSLARWRGDLGEWRDGLTAALSEILGLGRAEAGELDVKLLDRYERQGVTIERLLYNSEPGVAAPACLLLPHGVEWPRPAVVLCHDRGPGKMSALIEPRAGKGDPGQTLAHRLLAEGFIVMVPDALGYGERKAEESAQALVGAWLGRPLLGRWVHDVRRAADVLADRQEVVASRLAIAGLGIGGTTALHAMAVDERFRVGVVGGQLGSYADRIRALSAAAWRGLEEELPSLAPGLLAAAELEDVACLCAPRPLMMLHAPTDRWCPIDAARACAGRIAAGFGRLGASGLFESAWVPEIGSRANDAAREFLTRHLTAQWV